MYVYLYVGAYSAFVRVCARTRAVEKDGLMYSVSPTGP